MLYILGVNLSEKKSVKIALSAFYGIGIKTSTKICHKLNINPQYPVSSLTDSQINLLMNEIKNYTINMDLKKKIKSNVDKLILIKCYRGLRHNYGLPVRGQRTRSNGRTQKYLSNKLIKISKVKNLKKQKFKSKNKTFIKNKKKKK